MIAILGYGFLGKTLSEHFLQKGTAFKVATKNINALSAENHVYFDLNDENTYATALENVDTVIHLIHPTVPVTSSYDPQIDLVYNIQSNEKLLDFMIAQKIKRIIFISTGGAIYGEPLYQPVDEEHACHPISNYGKGKLLLEQLYLSKCTGTVTSLLILRPSNVYGKFQAANKPQGVIAHILDAARNDRSFSLWGKGDSKKDYLYAKDFSAAISAVLSSNMSGSSVYNVCSSSSYSVMEIIHLIENLLQKKVDVSYEEQLSFDVRNVLLSNRKFSDAFNWKPQYTLEDGLADLLKTRAS